MSIPVTLACVWVGSFFQLPKISCLFMGFSYTEKLAGYTAAVFVVVIVMCTTAFWGKLASKSHGIRKDTQDLEMSDRYDSYMKRVQDVTVNAVIVFLFIIFPSISFIALDPFACIELGQHGWRLYSDHRVLCPTVYAFQSESSESPALNYISEDNAWV
jgi:hypothetical protein